MIRATLKQQGTLLDDLAAYTESFQQVVDATLRTVVTESEPALLDELGYVPPLRDPSQKLNWTTPLQGIAFHASGGFGGGIPHKRTGALPNGWTVSIGVDGRAVIANNVPGAVYLYGSLSKSNPGKWQQGYLRAIGWLPAYQTVFVWTADIFEEVARRIHEQFGDMGSVAGKSRAYTRR